jgi:hypothetical protein
MPAVDTSPVTREELRRWRVKQGLTQGEAEEWWFGHHNDGRTWRRYELGERAIPAPLARTIAMMRRSGRKWNAGRRLDAGRLV